ILYLLRYSLEPGNRAENPDPSKGKPAGCSHPSDYMCGFLDTKHQVEYPCGKKQTPFKIDMVGAKPILIPAQGKRNNAIYKVSYCVEQRTVMKNSNQSHFQMSETRYASSNMKKSLNIKPFNNFHEV
ncbi:hypothetical protein EI555_007545, partial [Monodon monoceros]